jgi:hypothetical protein
MECGWVVKKQKKKKKRKKREKRKKRNQLPGQKQKNSNTKSAKLRCREKERKKGRKREYLAHGQDHVGCNVGVLEKLKGHKSIILTCFGVFQDIG